tara:strand:- start:483 stop:659 length:177 start_codon:yes stop_codon:yes gene_type:complete
MKGVKHYTASGAVHTGAKHKMKDGTMHTGKAHTAASKKLFHYSGLTKTAKAKTSKGKA